MAVTLEPVVADSPVEGDQLYVVAPIAIKFTALPPGLQIKALDGLTDIGGGIQSGPAALNRSLADEESFFKSLYLLFLVEIFWLYTIVFIPRKKRISEKIIL